MRLLLEDAGATMPPQRQPRQPRLRTQLRAYAWSKPSSWTTVGTTLRPWLVRCESRPAGAGRRYGPGCHSYAGFWPPDRWESELDGV